MRLETINLSSLRSWVEGSRDTLLAYLAKRVFNMVREFVSL